VSKDFERAIRSIESVTAVIGKPNDAFMPNTADELNSTEALRNVLLEVTVMNDLTY